MKIRILSIILFLAVGLGIFLFSGVLWIGIILMITCVAYLFFTSKTVQRKRGLFSILKGFSFVGIIFLYGIIIRLLFIEIYAIPSSSMESTLIPGDKILVDKVAYGPKLPRSPFEIPWINIFFYLNDKAREKMDVPWWSYQRLSGTSGIRRGEIIVFTKSYADKTPFVKRCVGMPGDVLKVENGLIKGHEKEKWMGNTLIPMGIKAYKREAMLNWLDSIQLGYSPLYISGVEKHMLKVKLPVKFLDDLLSLPYVDSTFLIEPSEQIRSWYLHSIDFTGNIYNYGPIRIPQKGEQIKLNRRNYAIYSHTIQKYENAEIVEDRERFFIDGKEVNTYTFQNDYYFMMGDNREDSQDSRYFGFIPEENIIGRADLILFSSGDDGFRWKRFFNML